MNAIPNLPIIGNTTYVDVAEFKHVPAKIDTGAMVSSIWASNISILEDGSLEFSLFGPKSPLYTGARIRTNDYSVRRVRNSTGDEFFRYTVVLSTRFNDRRIRISYTLADRSRNNFPILIGRRALRGKYLVDVSKVEAPLNPSPAPLAKLNEELQSDPQKFHQKYMSKPKK